MNARAFSTRSREFCWEDGILVGRDGFEGTLISGRESEEVEWPGGRSEFDGRAAEADI